MPAHFIDQTPDIVRVQNAKDGYTLALALPDAVEERAPLHAGIGRISIGPEAVCLSENRSPGTSSVFRAP
jgi:hypothetical protein